MFISRRVPPLRLLCRATGGLLQPHILRGSVRPVPLTCCSFQNGKHSKYAEAVAGKTSRPRWVRFEPGVAEALVPRKLSVSPLESWLSFRYSLPPFPENTQPPEDGTVLPPFSVPGLEDVGESSITPLGCKNVLEIRRRKMNRHKYKKLMKRMRFVRRRVLHGRRKKKQKRFEEDLERVWTRAGLKEPPEGWTAPKIYLKRHGNRRD